MQRTFFLMLLLALFSGGLYAQNVNAGFESGNLSNWSGNKGTRTIFLGICGDNTTPGFGPQHTLVTPGPDQYVGAIMPRVVEGNYALKLGGIGTKVVQRAWYHYTVTNTNPFKFYFALVMNDPGHSGCAQPFFQYKIRLGSISGPVLTDVRINADENDPYFTREGNLIYKNWDCYTLPVNPSWVGQQLVVEFISGNCTEGADAHFCYAYIDGLGSNLPLNPQFTLPKTTFCLGEDIIADASNTWLEKDHFWSVVESDANWNVINPANEKSQWFVAQQAGVKNITEFYEQLGGKFECNKYYRIKLAVVNSCVGWTETIKLVYFGCPDLNAGPDICYPNCGGGGSVVIGDQPNYPGRLTVQWLAGPGGNVSYLQNPGATLTTLSVPANGSFPQTYYLSATTSPGCTVYDTVKVFCGCPNLDLVTLEKLGTYLYRLNIPQSVLDNITSFEVRIYQNGSWVTYQNVLNPGLQHLFVFIDEEAPYQFVFKNPCCEKTKRFVLGQLGRTVPEETEELQDPEARMVPAGNESSAELRIYPNPVSGMLNIQLPAASEPGHTEIQLFTFDGRQLFSSAYSASFISLDMNAFPRGIYILRISSAAGVTSHRIVKE